MMDMTKNPNISKEFRTAIDGVTRWQKGQNPTVTVITHTYKNADGKEVTVFKKDKANDLWGKPQKFFMK